MDTTSKPFWVVMCSVCGKRINDDAGYMDDAGHAVHNECYGPAVLTSQESPTHTVPLHPLDRWRTFATKMIRGAIGVLAEGHN